MMRNNRGQVLVLFVLMIPILIFLVAFFIENMRISGEKSKLSNLNEILAGYASTHYEDAGLYDALLDLSLKNDKDVVISSFELVDNRMVISLSKSVDSLFGKIVGIDTYDVVSMYEIIIDGENVIYNRK